MNLALALGLLSLAVLLLQSCAQQVSPAQKLADQLNEGASDMLKGHSSEKIVIYHPEGPGDYVLRLEKHFPCSSMPCDAPAGQEQGMLKIHKTADMAGSLERWISVPKEFEVSRKGQDTAIILENKDWYAEVRAVY